MNLTINWPGRPAETLDLPTNFSYDEMSLIKRLTGLRAGEIVDALEANDSDMALAYAGVALRRCNPALSDAQIKAQLGTLEFGSIELDFRSEDEAAGDGNPPAGADDSAGDEPSAEDA